VPVTDPTVPVPDPTVPMSEHASPASIAEVAVPVRLPEHDVTAPIPEPEPEPALTIADPEPATIAEPGPTAIAEPEPTAIAEPEPTAIAEPEPTAITVPMPDRIAEPEPEPEPVGIVPPPSTPPESTPQAPPGRRNGLAIAAIAGVLIALVAGAVIVLSGGKSGGKKHQGGETQTAASGPVAITYPASWIAASDVAGNFVLGGGSTASSATPVQLVSGKLSLAAGQLKASAPIPGAVPPALVARYGRETSAADAVVAGANGRQYTWAPQGQRLVAYVLPAAAGDIAIICQAPFAGAADLGSCAALAQRAKISGTQVLAPGPDLATGATLNQDLAPVLAARSSLHGLTASSLPARAPKAHAAATAERVAAAAIASSPAPARYHALVARLTAALKKEASELSGLAAAAKAGQRAAYAAHVDGIRSASRALLAATNAFAPTGMRVKALSALHLAGPPPLPVPAAPTTPAAPAPSSPSTPAPTTQAPSAPSSPSPSPAPAPAPAPAPSGGGGGCGGTCTTGFH
jgi:hypothetical protein